MTTPLSVAAPDAVARVAPAVTDLAIETPSWGYGNSGTRFKVFPQPGVPRDPFEKAEDAATVAEAPYRVAIDLPKLGQRTYYNLLLDVETLSLTDLDEVERWLRGELKPAVRGQKNPGTALTRGLRTLVVRLLGGEKRHYEARSATFKP